MLEAAIKLARRNPHDIGRRILPYHHKGDSFQPVSSQSSWHWKANITSRDYAPKYPSPVRSQSSWHWKANITISSFVRFWKVSSRNPHDIGRRILQRFFYKESKESGVAILMTLEGEYYSKASVVGEFVGTSRNPHDIGRRILHARLAAIEVALKA